MITIIPADDADLDAAISALEATWEAGAKGVTIQRTPSVAVEAQNATGADHRLVDCNECQAILCTISCRDAQRACRIYQAEQEYAEKEKAFERAGENLRQAVRNA